MTLGVPMLDVTEAAKACVAKVVSPRLASHHQRFHGKRSQVCFGQIKPRPSLEVADITVPMLPSNKGGQHMQ
jgi:hypothetical protein